MSLKCSSFTQASEQKDASAAEMEVEGVQEHQLWRFRGGISHRMSRLYNHRVHYIPTPVYFKPVAQAEGLRVSITTGASAAG